MKKRSFTVDNRHKNKRLDKLLSQKYADLSRSYIQKLIKNKKVQVNNQKVTKKSNSLKPGM